MISSFLIAIIKSHLKPLVEHGIVSKEDRDSVVEALSFLPEERMIRYISKKQAAELLSVSTKTIERYVEDGQLKPYRLAAPGGVRSWVRLSEEQVLSLLKDA